MSQSAPANAKVQIAGVLTARAPGSKGGSDWNSRARHTDMSAKPCHHLGVPAIQKVLPVQVHKSGSPADCASSTHFIDAECLGWLKLCQ